MLRSIVVILFLIFSVISCADHSTYIAETSEWRATHEKELSAEDGWLTLTGLAWLKEGANTIGRGNEYDIRLTSNFKGGKFGEIDLSGSKATLTVEKGVEALIDGKPFGRTELASDKTAQKTVVQVGSQSFYLIEREGKFAVRLKDTESPERIGFKGLSWFPIDPSYRITADLEAFDQPEEVNIPNVLGSFYKMKSPGKLKFTLLGRPYTVVPVEDGDKLFIIFRDDSRLTETYEAGRFLYADKPVNGKVVLDFNRAENPPCAYTEFATCPLPPPENSIDASILAGEKRFRSE